MIYVLYTIHVVICLFLILVVLLQQGSGADLSVFGGGGTQTAFGARSATNLLHRLTVAGFVGFILTTMTIGLLKTGSSTVMEGVAPETPAQTAPAAPAAPAVDVDTDTTDGAATGPILAEPAADGDPAPAPSDAPQDAGSSDSPPAESSDGGGS